MEIDTLAIGDPWTTQEIVKGVSFDADMTTDGVYTELGDPYTYSDMTGNALGSVACAPEG